MYHNHLEGFPHHSVLINFRNGNRVKRLDLLAERPTLSVGPLWFVSEEYFERLEACGAPISRELVGISQSPRGGIISLANSQGSQGFGSDWIFRKGVQSNAEFSTKGRA
jgi:hypothetical protein